MTRHIMARYLTAEHVGHTLKRDRKIDRHEHQIVSVFAARSHVTVEVRDAFAGTKRLILPSSELVEVNP